MRLFSALVAGLVGLASLPAISATRLIKSTSLQTCIENSDFSASLFNVIFTPDNGTISIDIVAVSSLDGNITAKLMIDAYGLTILTDNLNPCDLGMAQLCPIKPGQFSLQSETQLSNSVVDSIPGIAYTVPDLDGVATVVIYNSTGAQVACVEASLSNGKTVNTPIVKWVTAVIAGLALLVSAIASGLGYSSTAAHVAANGLSLFGYFQNIAIIGMCSMPLPPLTSAWVQDFEWTMGIINVNFMQSIFTWYIQATGGTPSTLLQNLNSVSVNVQKRSLEYLNLAKRSASLVARSNNNSDLSTISTTYNLHGIRRVAYLAGIEITNLFVTGFTFFIFFTFIISFILVMLKLIFEGLSRMNLIRPDRFGEFRQRWLSIIKGIIYRMVLIGFPQMTILSLWELTERDSPAAIVLAVVMLLMVNGLLAWAAFKVIRLAKQSVAVYKNPAYILYSDAAALARWGFVYVQFRATAYYFIVPILVYTFIKACFIAFGQSAPTMQGIVLMVIEFFYLLLVAILKPYMDRRTNIFNITIQSVNFLNAILFFFFTGVTKVPGIVIGVMGVVFFVLNAAFALVLLIMIIISCLFALLSKNPDTRYQPMRDDRASFIKSTAQLPGVMELEALGATARGDTNAKY
ncbi:hypothetical protein V1525DRAFT_357913 [Lipomyces kononenkoae]|uniref:Uncharacterized protein n=1 Tax=Lipomyces kononenkoae TaxID=34357 RepID=A0ACC3T3U9_LIPKO